MREVRFSKQAVNDLQQISEYFKAKSSLRIKDKFLLKLEKLVLQIQLNPEMFPVSEKKKYYKAVVIKQVVLFYKYNASQIHIARVFDTRRNPKTI